MLSKSKRRCEMSGIKILLDTNVVLYFLNGDETLAGFFEDKDLYVFVITEMELLSYKGISDEETTHVEGFLSECNIVNIDISVKAKPYVFAENTETNFRTVL